MVILANVVVDLFTNGESATFLVAYLAILALMAAASWGLALMADKTANDAIPPIPVQPDPFEIAYLRGGAADVLRLMLFDLASRGYLILTTEESVFTKSYWIDLAPGAPSVSYLTSMEQQVMATIKKGISLSELMQDEDVLTVVESHCTAHELSLVQQSMLLSDTTRRWLRGVRIAGLMSIAFIGGVKLLIAQDMLLFVAIMTALTLVVILLGIKVRRRTDKGQRYLDALAETFQTMRHNATQHRDIGSTHGLLLGAIYGPQVMAQEDMEDGPMF